ncbi:ACT domain-containing protein [Anaerolentibacter hominis]|uniref:ACT domain-containing protein n=1 Tax=Anaerolentibacter hominis TaxID=3079009 RepID=UPI0031B853DE
MNKLIITVVGKDSVGIIAKVCTYLSNNRVNILDISQTIVQGYFNMMMIVDSSAAEKDVHLLADELEQIGGEIGVSIRMQHEDIFNKMHRI